MAEKNEGAPVSAMRSLERALDVLRVLEAAATPLRLAELARLSRLHIATTQRIVNVLAQYDYIKQDAAGYSMGVASVLNAHAFLVTNPLLLVATPVLQELATSTGMTSSLSIRVAFSQVLLIRIEGAYPLRYQLPLGEKLPLQLGGARVLAAAMTTDEVERLLDSVGEIRLASGETVAHEEFISSLALIREQGYAYGRSQRAPGAASISVPVLNRDGAVIAAVQVSGLEEDFDSTNVPLLVGELQRASSAITRRHP
jgi:IclR family acetate operon transcriptional repressor